MKINLRHSIITGLLLAVIAVIFTVIAYYIPAIKADMVPGDFVDLGTIESSTYQGYDSYNYTYNEDTNISTYNIPYSTGDWEFWTEDANGELIQDNPWTIPTADQVAGENPFGMVIDENPNSGTYGELIPSSTENNIAIGGWGTGMSQEGLNYEATYGENGGIVSEQEMENIYNNLTVDIETGTESFAQVMNFYSADAYNAWVQGQGEVASEYLNLANSANPLQIAETNPNDNIISSILNKGAQSASDFVNAMQTDVNNINNGKILFFSPSSTQDLKNILNNSASTPEAKALAQKLLQSAVPVYSDVANQQTGWVAGNNLPATTLNNISNISPIKNGSEIVSYLIEKTNGEKMIIPTSAGDLVNLAKDSNNAITKSAFDAFLKSSGAKIDSSGKVTDSNGNEIAHATPILDSVKNVVKYALDSISSPGGLLGPAGGGNGSFGTTLPSWIKGFYGWAVGIAGLLATAVLIYAGYLYATSAGNPEQVNLAKEYVIGALSGLAFLLLAVIIYNTIKVNESGGGGQISPTPTTPIEQTPETTPLPGAPETPPA